MGAEVFYADGQMDMTNAPENVKYFSVCGRQMVDNFLLALIWS